MMFVVCAVLFVAVQPPMKEDPATPFLRQAAEAMRDQKPEAAEKAASQAVAANPQSPIAYFVRAQIRAALRKHAEAIGDYTEALKRKPDYDVALDRRGDAHLKVGNFADAVADFEKFLAKHPDQRPNHWRLGIALYYAGKYAEGVKLFELHRTVNPEDVENSVWHFLCNARATDLTNARMGLIPVTRDTRVPMKEVLDLFAGKAKPEDVLAAAEKVEGARKTEALFYAHLYLGLYCEAVGEKEKVRGYLTPAVEKFQIGHYMWDIAAVHLKTLAK